MPATPTETVVVPLADRPLLEVTVTGLMPVPSLRLRVMASPPAAPKLTALTVTPPPDDASPAPLARVRELVALAPVRRSVPPVTDVAPVYVWGLEKIMLPEPDLVTDPEPEMALA